LSDRSRYSHTGITTARAAPGSAVLISHRFSSVRMADVIVVLADGAVVEHGTHAQPLATDGHDAQMYRQQASA
jgi:ATP-binding cassette subfamily B protein